MVDVNKRTDEEEKQAIAKYMKENWDGGMITIVNKNTSFSMKIDIADDGVATSLIGTIEPQDLMIANKLIETIIKEVVGKDEGQ